MWRKSPDADSAFRNTCDAAALGSGAGCHDAAAAEVGPCGPVVLRIKTWGSYTKRNRLGIFMIFDGDNNNEWQWWFEVSTNRVAPTNCGIIKATLGGAGEVYIFICCFCSHLECGFYTEKHVILKRKMRRKNRITKLYGMNCAKKKYLNTFQHISTLNHHKYMFTL